MYFYIPKWKCQTSNFIPENGGPGTGSFQVQSLLNINLFLGFVVFQCFQSVIRMPTKSSMEPRINSPSSSYSVDVTKHVTARQKSINPTTNWQLRVWLNQANITHHQFPEPGSPIFSVFVARPTAFNNTRWRNFSIRKNVETTKLLRCEFVCDCVTLNFGERILWLGKTAWVASKNGNNFCCFCLHE